MYILAKYNVLLILYNEYKHSLLLKLHISIERLDSFEYSA